MKQGTISWLVGCHSVIHSYYVWKAWREVHGRYPRAWETCCILIHDIGHWGKQYLDDLEAKKRHWEAGAKLAGQLFGKRGHDLVAGHCEYSGYPPGDLYKPDKVSWKYEPYWWAWWNALVEPKLKMGYPLREAYERFHAAVLKNIELETPRGNHQLYLERCEEKKENKVTEEQKQPETIGVGPEQKPEGPRFEVKVHDRCPVCGSQEKVTPKVTKYLRDTGYLEPQDPDVQNQFLVQVTSQERLKKQILTALDNRIKVRTVVYMWDVCNNCGTVYVTDVAVVEQEGMFQPQPAPPPPRFRNMPGLRGGLRG